MSIITELKDLRAQQFVALILDNEVTVGEFVTGLPLPLSIIQSGEYFKSPKDIRKC